MGGGPDGYDFHDGLNNNIAANNTYSTVRRKLWLFKVEFGKIFVCNFISPSQVNPQYKSTNFTQLVTKGPSLSESHNI